MCVSMIAQQMKSSSNVKRAKLCHNNDDNVIDMLAAKLTALSTSERERVSYDLHGVTEPIEETPDLVEKAICELLCALSSIPVKPAFDVALDQDPELLLNHEFLLKFLRASSFDAQYAAKKIVEHLEQKRALFGDSKILKDISIEDLGPEELVLLERGWIGALPLRDQASRSVLYLLPSVIATENFSAEARMRLIIYAATSWVTPNNTGSQRDCVVISVKMGSSVEYTNNPGKFVATNAAAFAAVPIRIAAAHLFETTLMMTPEIFESLEDYHQVRIKPHLLSPDDFESLHFTLSTFGIPTDLLPISKGGELNLTYHSHFVKSLKTMPVAEKRHLLQNLPPSKTYHHSSAGSKSLFAEPSPQDVLHGNDSYTRNHSGNVRFHSLIESLFDEYDAIPDRLKRVAISERVFDTIHTEGGLFLERASRSGGPDSDVWWQEVPDATALSKIGNAFRSLRKKKQLAKQQTQTAAR